MMFKDYVEIEIPEGKVTKIRAGDVVLWVQPQIGNIPNEYQEVEWISAAANVGAYIKLGFTYNKGAEIRLGQWIMNENTAYPFGAAESSGTKRCMFSSPYNGGVSVYASNGPSFITMEMRYKLGALNELSATFKTGAWVIRNATLNYVSRTSDMLVDYTMTNELYLFAQNYNGSPRFGDERRISYFQYEDNDGNLICDLVPCYRKSDGEIGTYDKARGLFLTNAGTGSFTKGPDV